MAEHLAMLQRTVDRLGGGKAVDYAAAEAAIAEGAQNGPGMYGHNGASCKSASTRLSAHRLSRTELAAHRAILKSLDRTWMFQQW